MPRMCLASAVTTCPHSLQHLSRVSQTALVCLLPSTIRTPQTALTQVCSAWDSMNKRPYTSTSILTGVRPCYKYQTVAQWHPVIGIETGQLIWRMVETCSNTSCTETDRLLRAVFWLRSRNQGLRPTTTTMTILCLLR